MKKKVSAKKAKAVKKEVKAPAKSAAKVSVKVAAKPAVKREVAVKKPMVPKEKTFMERLLAGEDVGPKLDEFIDNWQFSKDPNTAPVLFTYLGMTSAELKLLMTDANNLPDIIAKRKAKSA